MERRRRRRGPARTRRARTRRGRVSLGGLIGVRSLPALPAAVWALAAVLALAGANWVYQAARKPTELLGLVVPAAAKSPAATWAEYGPLFEEHATEVVTPELLAALVQVESAGDPLARTYWRWRWSWNPLELWAPASSAVGILQITDGTFAEGRRFCIHDHAVARDGAWLDPRACWFNALYTRTIASHAIEMTSARLHLVIEETLAARGLGPRASPDDRQRLAAVIHLCGRERGASFAQGGFRALRGERCGDHELREYLGRVDALRAVFGRLRG